MPPRSASCGFAVKESFHQFRTRPWDRTAADVVPWEVISQSRSFHQHPRCLAANKTFPRRQMWEWLRGPGKAFRDPLKSSTNYLTAYDKRGNLIRSRASNKRSQDADVNLAAEQTASLPEEADIRKREEAEGLSSDERARRAKERADVRQRMREAETRSGLPPERLSDMRPFPLNESFRSQSVLSEALREELYKQVVLNKIDISTVSAAFGVDMRRVAAVVRLKAIEKQWIDKEIPLAQPYATAVLDMLPQTPYNPQNSNNPITPHEPINDISVHPWTRVQIFQPTSESRDFTRADAAHTFDKNLMPADNRIPHPELIMLEKEHLAGISRAERWARQLERDNQAKEKKDKDTERKKQHIERTQMTVAGKRWDFKFEDFNAENTGPKGRRKDAVGIRYGWPHEDRKRGLVKIPTQVL